MPAAIFWQGLETSGAAPHIGINELPVEPDGHDQPKAPGVVRTQTLTTDVLAV